MKRKFNNMMLKADLLIMDLITAGKEKLKSNKGEMDEKMVLVVLALLAGIAIFTFVLKNLLPQAFTWIENTAKKLFNWS